MKLKSIWGLLIAIIEIEINETLFCTRFEKNLKKKEECLPKKETPKKGRPILYFSKSVRTEDVSPLCSLGEPPCWGLFTVGYNA